MGLVLLIHRRWICKMPRIKANTLMARKPQEEANERTSQLIQKPIPATATRSHPRIDCIRNSLLAI
jgi:hypothetical protein